MRRECEIEKRRENAIRCEERYGECLYHYTSFPSLYSIISKKELWFGNASTMNDKSEMTDFVTKLKVAVLKDFSEKEDQILQLFGRIEEKFGQEYPYEMCFSKLSDNAAQWERYADSAKGVCIVFKTKMLSQLFYYNRGLLNEAFYEYDVRYHTFYEMLCNYLSSPDSTWIDNEASWVDNLLKTASLYKHGSFISEAECRVVIFPQIRQPDKDKQIYSVAYKLIHNQIKKVLVVNLEGLCQHEGIHIEDLFDRLIIAPKSDQNKEVLEGFCAENGFSGLAKRIYYSDCPLR